MTVWDMIVNALGKSSRDSAKVLEHTIEWIEELRHDRDEWQQRALRAERALEQTGDKLRWQP